MSGIEFSTATMKAALRRQHQRCGSCGTRMTEIGLAGRDTHRHGEGAEAHHIRHVKAGGRGDLANCVILCKACHYSVHEGGNFRRGTVQGSPSDFRYYWG